ncbi:hypothetical protein [Methylomicrobium sp. Wu6]|uniref:hypothetical protein n=1 Tax=Methylomicrobium sp. Wu6 TaxID=3107928 RepID=UPI002DD6A094|nr:hypothetical protein [Methylomicrobium sp. Wu6]MEC4750034.1 hypothetical protein [Methylomicrobium sp. Wu6]
MVNDLQSQIDALRAELKTTDDWATGVFLVLEQILPFLLRGHPEIAKIQQSLKHSEERFEELSAHPERAEDSDETAEKYEAAKILYRQLALLGVWPNSDPGKAAR